MHLTEGCAVVAAGRRARVGAIAAMLRRRAYQQIAPVFQSLRWLSRCEAVCQVVPAAVSAGSLGNWLSSVFGGDGTPKGCGIPITEPLPGFVEPTPAYTPAEPPSTELTTLPNGFRVASENSWVRDLVSLYHLNPASDPLFSELSRKLID